MLNYYLIELIKEDDSIIVFTTNRNKKDKLLYFKIKITFVNKNAPLAIKLQKVFKTNILKYSKNIKYLNLLFQDVISLEKIIIFINNKIKTFKIKTLHKMINWLNARLITSKF